MVWRKSSRLTCFVEIAVLDYEWSVLKGEKSFYVQDYYLNLLASLRDNSLSSNGELLARSLIKLLDENLCCGIRSPIRSPILYTTYDFVICLKFDLSLLKTSSLLIIRGSCFFFI